MEAMKKIVEIWSDANVWKINFCAKAAIAFEIWRFVMDPRIVSMGPMKLIAQMESNAKGPVDSNVVAKEANAFRLCGFAIVKMIVKMLFVFLIFNW